VTGHHYNEPETRNDTDGVARDVSTTETDRQRYESWVSQWADELYRLAYRLCGSRDTAGDLVQETFYHAWRSIGTLRDESRARAWLFQILRYRYAHWVRTDTRRPKVVAPLDKAPPVKDDGTEKPLERLERQETVQRALDELDERYRLPLVLVFMEGMTCQEAADELGVPLGTILSRIHRARKHLRARLEHIEGRTTLPRGEGPELHLRLGDGA